VESGEPATAPRGSPLRQQVVYLDGRFMPEPQARIPLLTHALQYGTGIFEGIRAYLDRHSGDALLFRATDHFERMKRNVRFLRIDLPAAPHELAGLAAELVRLNGFDTDCLVRAIAYKSDVRIGVSLPEKDSFAMVAVPVEDDRDGRRGLHCGVSSWRRLSDSSIPCRAKICGAYVNSALAAQEARERRFDEAILLNEEGCVAEGSSMNVFLVRDERLVTPHAAEGILEGITRDTVMTLARQLMNIETDARAVDRAELYVADEMFLCGTAAQIAPVIRIDGRTVGGGEPGPVTLELQQLYEQAVHGQLRDYRHWVEPVYGYARATV